MSFSKMNSSDRIALGAVMIALVSLGVSLRSCQQTDRSLRFATQEFDAARSFFWTGTVTDTDDLQLLLSNPEVKIQRALLTFPAIFNMASGEELGPSGELAASQMSVSLRRVHHDLIEMIRKDTAYTRSGATMGLKVPMFVPIVIQTSYLVKGEVRVDRSLYILPYYTVLSFAPINAPTPSYEPKIFFKQLRFAGHIGDEDAATVVERIWSKG